MGSANLARHCWLELIKTISRSIKTCLFCYCLFAVFFAAEKVRSIVICEGNNDTINCENERKIYVVDANYGRLDNHTCSDSRIKTASCRAGDSLSIVRKQCNGIASCKLHAGNSTFGDPFSGTFKYLEVKYKCVDLRSKKTINVLCA